VVNKVYSPLLIIGLWVWIFLILVGEMALSRVEKELFEEKFKGVYARLDANFDIINASLHNIENNFGKRLNDVEHKVDGIDKDLIEYRVVKKYPKIAVIILAVSVLLFLFSISSTISANQKLKVLNNSSELYQKSNSNG